MGIGFSGVNIYMGIYVFAPGINVIGGLSRQVLKPGAVAHKTSRTRRVKLVGGISRAVRRRGDIVVKAERRL